MPNDRQPDDEHSDPSSDVPPDPTELDAWSRDRHRELEAFSRRDVELAEQPVVAEAAPPRRSEVPPELLFADDDDLGPGPRRRLVMGTSRVVAVVALVAAAAIALTAVL